MTVQELVTWCIENNVSLDTQIALRAKDDYLLTHDSVSLENAYFGNSRAGIEWQEQVATRDANGNIDYESIPKVFILDTGRG